MASRYRLFTVLVYLLLPTAFCFGQSEIKVEFLGNAGFRMTDGKTNIYFDFPYKSGAYGYMEYDKASLAAIPAHSVFIFTHKHADHFSRKLVNQAGGTIYAGSNRKQIARLSEAIPAFEITPYRTKHKFAISHYSYLITWHGKKFFVAGDTEHPKVIQPLTGLDYVFVPYWFLSIAKEDGIRVDADHRVLLHLYPDQKIEGELPPDIIVFNKAGTTITVPY